MPGWALCPVLYLQKDAEEGVQQKDAEEGAQRGGLQGAQQGQAPSREVVLEALQSVRQ